MQPAKLSSLGRFPTKVIIAPLIYYKKSRRMCTPPCQTCFTSNFYSCLTCAPGLTLSSSLCLTSPTQYYQIITTCLVFLFILPILLRKRGLTLVKILDLIQLAAYFKLLRGYCANRHVWLYLGMRGWGDWAEGWKLVSGGLAMPIWTTEETVINKVLRIVATWLFFAVAGIAIGVMKLALSQADLTFQKYMSKNIGNIFSYAFYFTLQDIAFVVAAALLNPDFSSALSIVGFCLGVVFVLLTLLYMSWCFYRINFPAGDQKYYHYKYFFLFSADYDLFPTYSLLDLPAHSKQIRKYSNIRLLDMLKKIAYAFLIVGYLSSPQYATATAEDQIYQVLGFLVFFQLLWLMLLPYNLKKQYLQFALAVLAFGVTVYLLVGPWLVAEQLVSTILVLVLFGLAMLSLLFELCLDIYKIVPVDLYETGLKVVIEDHRLLKEIAQRRKQQEEMQRKIRDIQLQNQKLKDEMEQRQRTSQAKIADNQPVRQDSEGEIFNNNKGDAKPEPDNEQRTLHNEAAQRASMNSDELAELYRVDQLKRRKVYQWNKQQPFAYSNRME